MNVPVLFIVSRVFGGKTVVEGIFLNFCIDTMYQLVAVTVVSHYAILIYASGMYGKR